MIKVAIGFTAVLLAVSFASVGTAVAAAAKKKSAYATPEDLHTACMQQIDQVRPRSGGTGTESVRYNLYVGCIRSGGTVPGRR
jgi:hypothetical protein